MMGSTPVIMLYEESEGTKPVDFELILGGPHIIGLQPLKRVRDLKRERGIFFYWL